MAIKEPNKRRESRQRRARLRVLIWDAILNSPDLPDLTDEEMLVIFSELQTQVAQNLLKNSLDTESEGD